MSANQTHEPKQLPDSSSPAPRSATSQPIPLSWVDALFERLILTYGAKFADLWHKVDQAKVKALWAEELGEYGRDEIARGVASLKTRDWPPTLPEFLKLCRPPIEPTGAHAEACEKYPLHLEGKDVTWSRPEIYWAAVKVGAWNLKNVMYRQLETRWKDALENASREAPPAPRKAIAETSGAHTDPEVRARVAEGLRSLQAKPLFKPMPVRDEARESEWRAAEAEIARRGEVI